MGCCSNCGSVNLDKAKFCLKCGYALNPSADSARRNTDNEQENACSKCGFRNPKEARFCEQCGAGLFENCLNCKREIRVGSLHCIHCGVCIPEAKKINEHLIRAKEYISKVSYKKAHEELQMLMQIKPTHEEAITLNKDVEEKLSKSEKLRNLANDLYKNGDYNGAQKAISTYLELIPEDDEIEAISEKIAEHINHDNYDFLIKLAEEAYNEGDFEKAIANYEQATQLLPGNSTAMEKASYLKNTLEQAQGILTKAIELNKEGLWEQALSLLDDGNGDSNKSDDSKESLNKALKYKGLCDLRKELIENIETERNSLDIAKKYVAKKRYTIAIKVYKEILSIRSNNAIAMSQLKIARGKIRLRRAIAVFSILLVGTAIAIPCWVKNSRHKEFLRVENLNTMASWLKYVEANPNDAEANRKLQRTKDKIKQLDSIINLTQRQRYLLENINCDTIQYSSTNKQGLPEFKHIKTGIELIMLPGGTFRMGSNEHSDSRPSHEVDMPSFLIGKCEVSLGQWFQIMGTNPFMNLNPTDHGNVAVGILSWHDCLSYCIKTGLDLPSEAEWEYACRGGVEGDIPFDLGKDGETFTGSNVSRNWSLFFEYVWVMNNSMHGPIKNSYFQPIGQLRPNNFGIHDMVGHIGEWCKDVYHDLYKGAPADGSAWVEGGDSNIRVYRTGGTTTGSQYNTSPDLSPRRAVSITERDKRNSHDKINGFRVVLRANSIE